MLRRRLLALAVPFALSAAPVAQGFVERAAEVGLDHWFLCGLDRVGDLPNIHDWVQIGMGAGDLDADGDLDLIALGRMAPNRLFSNQGGTFVDVGAAAGVRSPELDTSVAVGDWDADGDLDLVFGSLVNGEGAEPGDGRLLRNLGGGAFEDVTPLAGRLGRGHTIAVEMFDLDVDGHLDLYLSEFHGTPNALYWNRGGLGFVEGAAAAGADVGGSTHVTAILDLNGDGWVDLSLGNDWPVSSSAGFESVEGEVLLMGNPDGTWTDVSAGSGAHEWHLETMGIAVGDVDYDGDADTFRTELGAQVLLINNGWPEGSPFGEEAYAYGVDAPIVPDLANPGFYGETTGWGALFTDLDFDPWLDLFWVNGQICPFGADAQRNFLFRGEGPGAGFHLADATEALGLYDQIDDRVALGADLDADGDVDLLVGTPGGGIRYFENRIDPAGQGWLSVLPRARTSAPGGAGTVVSWTDSLGYPHVRWIGAGGEAASCREPRAHFGLGAEPSVDVSVAFPSGVTVERPGTAPNTALVVDEPLLAEVVPAVSDAAAGGAQPVGGGAAAAQAPVAGEVAVRAFAHAPDGAELGPDAEVAIEVPGLRPAGPVEHVRGNEFRRAFHAAKPGVHRVELTFDGFQVRTRPAAVVRGGVADATDARLFPEAVRAGSADAARLVVVPRDARGVPLGAGRAVSVALPGGSVAALDLGDGRYEAVVPAPATSGALALDVTVDGTLLPALATLEAAAQASAARSEVYTEEPNPILSSSPKMMRVLITPRDADDLRLGPGADVELVLTPGPGSPPAAVRDDLGPNAKEDGQHWFVIEKDADPAVTAFGSFAVVVDGVALGSLDYQI